MMVNNQKKHPTSITGGGVKMNMNEIILKKRKGEILTKQEIDYFVKGYTEGDIPDYQISALLMTFMFNELDHDEIFCLTDAMKNSGDSVDLSRINGIKVDKHSTGGVGDKTTLIVCPIASACGVPIAKMSGRGLGFTGGTVDKMESIPGMKTTLSEDDFISQVNNIGISVIGQTGKIAPADKKIYALRDVTATVDNLGLIASSVMSKKLAAGADAFVLDVKCGSGAFMNNPSDAIKLGEIMVEQGKRAGKETIAVITDMNQPLGRCVGNSLEVKEAMETLKSNGPEDIMELSVELASHIVLAGGIENTYQSAKEKVIEALESGRALDKFRQFIEAQGGDPDITEDYSLLGTAKYSERIYADQDGYLNKIDAGMIGLCSQRAGAGRETKEDAIDMNAGLILDKKVCDSVLKGDVLGTVYCNSQVKLNEAVKIGEKAFFIEKEKPETNELIKKIIV